MRPYGASSGSKYFAKVVNGFQNTHLHNYTSRQKSEYNSAELRKLKVRWWWGCDDKMMVMVLMMAVMMMMMMMMIVVIMLLLVMVVI